VNKPYSFSVPYDVAEKLTPKERFVYYELCRLAATEPTKDTTFGVTLEPGSLITSHYRLSKVLDYAYSQTAIIIEHLAYKDLVEITPIAQGGFQSYYLIRVKSMDQGTKVRPEDRLFPF
jgi:hypothetical protein